MKFRKKLALGNFEFEKIAPSSGQNVQKFNIFATRESKFLEIQKKAKLSLLQQRMLFTSECKLHKQINFIQIIFLSTERKQQLCLT